MPQRPNHSENVTPEQSFLPPAPELSQGAGAEAEAGEEMPEGSVTPKTNMVSLADFDLIKVFIFLQPKRNSLKIFYFKFKWLSFR